MSRDKSVAHIDAIDRGSYEPVYSQLANILRRQIAEGVYRPGDQLPSEAELCRMYDVSPMTVRRSINLLADQDVVSTAQGRGTFVRALELSTATFHLDKLQELFTQDDDTEIKLLDVRIVVADSRITRKLQLEEGQNVIYIRRLLTRRGEPIFYHRAYLVYDPSRPIVEAEMDATSLQGLFTNARNTLLKFGDLKIEATLMNEEEARILESPLPSAAFYLEHLFCDFNDRPISWGWFICRADQLSFSSRIGLDEPALTTDDYPGD